MAEKIFLIRHGQVPDEYTGRYIGATDVGLGEAGRVQAGNLSRFISRTRFGRIFCSPMKRCVETAEIAGVAVAEEIEIRESLQEVDFGDWERMLFSDIV